MLHALIKATRSHHA